MRPEPTSLQLLTATLSVECRDGDSRNQKVGTMDDGGDAGRLWATSACCERQEKVMPFGVNAAPG